MIRHRPSLLVAKIAQRESNRNSTAIPLSRPSKCDVSNLQSSDKPKVWSSRAVYEKNKHLPNSVQFKTTQNKSKNRLAWMKRRKKVFKSMDGSGHGACQTTGRSSSRKPRTLFGEVSMQARKRTQVRESGVTIRVTHRFWNWEWETG